MSHGTKNVPPPFVAMMRGKRQTFPVPIAIPKAARMSPQREEKRSVFDTGPRRNRVRLRPAGRRTL